MEPYADLNCILKVNVDCEACKMKIVEVLSSVVGVYSVDIDAREGLAKVAGEVDPNSLLKALARTGKHAELAWVKLKHPVLNNREDYSSYQNNYANYNYNYDEPHHRYNRGLHGHSANDNNNYYGQQHYNYPMRRPFAGHQQHHPNYYHQYPHHGYGYGQGYSYGYGPYGGAHSSRYPPHMYSYADDPSSTCSIM